MDVINKVAVVTGGASGLGRAAAEELVNAGMRVVLWDISEAGLQEAVSELGDNADYVIVDVTAVDSVEQGVAQVLARHDAIHLLLNCAGVAPAKKILDRENRAMPLDDFSKVININLIGSFNTARLVAQAMTANQPDGEAGERGVIINTASVAAYDGQVGQSAYAASKGGIVSLTLPLARDLAGQGIRVNTIAPGIMGTPMLLAMPDKVQESLVANVQFPKRMGLPSEFGQLALHIAQNGYLNGETIRLDAAIRMPPR